MHYASLTDEELAEAYQAGDGRAVDVLLDRYRPLMQKTAHYFFACGMEREDVVQFIRIQLWTAIQSYRRGKGELRSLMITAAKRGAINALKFGARDKHKFLNLSMRFEALETTFDEEGLESYHLSTTVNNPETIALQNLATEDLKRWIIAFKADLTEIEWIAIRDRALGYSYKETATNACVSPKTIDNAIRRACIKARRVSIPLSSEHQHAYTRSLPRPLDLPVRERTGRSRSVRDSDNRLSANRNKKRVAKGD